VDPSDVEVVTSSRVRPMLLLGLALLMWAASAWLLVQPNGVAAGRLGVVVFGLIALFALLGLVWAPQLVLDAQGLEFRSLLPIPRRCAWGDISQIEAQRFGATRFVKIVMKPGRGSVLALGGSWPMGADQLAARLDGWRTRHGSHAAA
jgi:hypothetical protein